MCRAAPIVALLSDFDAVMIRTRPLRAIRANLLNSEPGGEK